MKDARAECPYILSVNYINVRMNLTGVRAFRMLLKSESHQNQFECQSVSEMSHRLSARPHLN